MRPASSILASVLPTLLERTPLTAEKTEFAWRTVVGDAVARATRVNLSNGVLWVAADDQRWLREVNQARESILARLNALLGADTVRVIKVRQ
jgi:predicted nucleic acid-binding Zn ribbon protein